MRGTILLASAFLRVASVLASLLVLQVALPAGLLVTKAYAVANVCALDDLDWDEIAPQDQQALMVLGWNEALWDGEGDAAPPSLAKDWVDLTPGEKAAATRLRLYEQHLGRRRLPRLAQGPFSAPVPGEVGRRPQRRYESNSSWRARLRSSVCCSDTFWRDRVRALARSTPP